MNTVAVFAFVTYVFCFNEIEGRQFNQEMRDYKREASSLDANSIYADIVETVSKIKNRGVSSDDLKSATQRVISSVGQLVTVSQGDAVTEILEAAATINLRIEAEALLNSAPNGLEPIEVYVRNIEVALKIWQALAEKGESLQGADNAGVLSAVSVIADRINSNLGSVADNLSELLNGRDTSNVAANHLTRSMSEGRQKRGRIGFNVGPFHVSISW